MKNTPLSRGGCQEGEASKSYVTRGVASIIVRFRIYSEKITTYFRLHAKGYGGGDDIILSRHVHGFG